MSFRIILAIGVLFAACDPPPQPKPSTSEHHVLAAMGGTTFQQPIHDGRCEVEGDVIRYEAVATTTDGQTFRSAIARIRGEEVFSVSAFISNVVVEGEPYSVVMLTADSSIDGDASSCRIEDEQIICNEMRRVPWRDGHVQTANVKIPLLCREPR